MVVETNQWLLSWKEACKAVKALHSDTAPTEFEIQSATAQAQLRKVAERQEELCSYYLDVGGSGPVMRGHCDHCRQALRKEAGLDA